jgi:hypothetical protein
MADYAFGSNPPYEFWPDLDEDLGIAGMLQGRPAA